MNREMETDIDTLLYVTQTTREDLRQSRELYSVLCGDLTRKELYKEGDACIYATDSLGCTAETNNIVKQLHSSKN